MSDILCEAWDEERRSKKAIIERARAPSSPTISATPPASRTRRHDTNHDNGTNGETVLTDDGPLGIEVPRDREGMKMRRRRRTFAAALPTMLETRRQGPGFQQALGWMLDLPLGASEWVKVARDELRQLLAGSGRSLA